MLKQQPAIYCLIIILLGQRTTRYVRQSGTPVKTRVNKVASHVRRFLYALCAMPTTKFVDTFFSSDHLTQCLITVMIYLLKKSPH